MCSMEKELDELLKLLEDQKKAMHQDQNHSEFAYVTYEDLQKLPLWNQENNQNRSLAANGNDGATGLGSDEKSNHNTNNPGGEDQSLVIAIQTPSGSHLKLYNQLPATTAEQIQQQGRGNNAT